MSGCIVFVADRVRPHETLQRNRYGCPPYCGNSDISCHCLYLFDVLVNALSQLQHYDSLSCLSQVSIIALHIFTDRQQALYCCWWSLIASAGPSCLAWSSCCLRMSRTSRSLWNFSLNSFRSIEYLPSGSLPVQANFRTVRNPHPVGIHLP